MEAGKILVNIFFNYRGFQETYNNSGIADLATTKKFLVGFNRELPLVAYTDAGADKEAADHKIKCKHVRIFTADQC